MAITRSQLLKELEPGLNALFGMEYDRYDNEHAEIFDTETSDRAFEEEVMLSGFGQAPVKGEGSAISYDTAGEAFTARYTHNTVALAFAITEEAVEDNLYDKLSARYTRALARSMSNTKQVTAASVLNNAFSSSYTGGDGVSLVNSAHPTTGGGNWSNTLATQADLNETSLEQALIDIAAFIDERGLKVALRGMKLIIPRLFSSPPSVSSSPSSAPRPLTTISTQSRRAATCRAALRSTTSSPIRTLGSLRPTPRMG